MIVFPRFAYLYTRKEYPARGIAAWAVMRQEYPRRWMGWLDAQRLLRRAFGISSRHVRLLLYKGEGTFWRRRGNIVELFTVDDLWAGVHNESVVEAKAIVMVPLDALRTVRTIRAYLSQTVLTRGDKPVSLAYSAKRLARGLRSVTTYRALLVARGLLKIDKQYVRRNKMPGVLTLDTPLPNPCSGQFEKGQHMWQRLPDIVTLVGQTIELRARMPAAASEIRPRRYFNNTRELERWEMSGLPLSEDALVSEITEGRPSGEWTNLLRGNRRVEYTSEYSTTTRAKGSCPVSSTARKLRFFGALQRGRREL